jgi:hypothetical protein
MQRLSVGFGIVAALLVGGTSHAHSFPGRAPTLKADLVQGYPPCTAPDTTTHSGRAACLAPPELDPACLFGSKGFGTLTATISKLNVNLKADLKGLDPLCEGRTLTAALTVRTTTDDCPDEHCTVTDYQLTTGSCTVKKGKCHVSASIPSGYLAGEGSEMTIVTCGMKDGDATAFTCGIMVK